MPGGQGSPQSNIDHCFKKNGYFLGQKICARGSSAFDF